MQEKQIAYIYKINDKFKQKQGIFTQLEKKLDIQKMEYLK